jgi:hypothetical protein
MLMASQPFVGVHSGELAILCNQSMITILEETWWINPWLQEITFLVLQCHRTVVYHKH